MLKKKFKNTNVRTINLILFFSLILLLSSVTAEILKFYNNNDEINGFNVKITQGQLNISYKDYYVIYMPLFQLQNDNILTWNEIPSNIQKDFWVTGTGNKRKYGVDFYNITEAQKNSIKNLIFHRIDVNGLTQNDVVKNGNEIIIKNKIILSHDDILRNYDIVSLNYSDVVVYLHSEYFVCDNHSAEECLNGHNQSNFILNPDGTYNITIDPTITILEDEWILDAILINVTAEGGKSNHTHLNISADAPYDSLVAYWSFDGDLENTALTTAYDWSGNGNDGILAGDSVVNSTGGRYGEGLLLDGDGDYVDVSNDPSFNITGTITVSAWVNVVETDSLQRFVGKRGGGVAGSAYTLQYNNAPTNKIRWQLCVSSSCYNADSNSDISTNQWVFLAGVYNGTASALYVNGVKQTDIEAVSGSIDTNSDPLTIGASDTSGTITEYVNGSIDEMMIFNTSLTSEQIQAIYNNQSARFKPTGRQDLNNQSILNISSGNNRVNVSTTIENNFDSQINLTIGYYDGSWSATPPQVVVSNTNLTFEISSTSTNLTLNYTFIAGNSTSNSFYSPIIKDNIIFDAYSVSVGNCWDDSFAGVIYVPIGCTYYIDGEVFVG